MPEVVVFVGGELVFGGESFEGLAFEDGLVVVDVVEGLWFEDEEAAVDPSGVGLRFFVEVGDAVSVEG